MAPTHVRQFLDFEQPIKDLYEEIDENRKLAKKSESHEYDPIIKKLEKKILEKRKAITDGLTPWQKVQLSRHPDRPYTLEYILKIFTNFIELHGDRKVKDDKAIIGGLAELDGEPIMIVGHQKGTNTKMRQMRNFGMANPEGYRKANRLMKLAEKFNIPVITFIDTPGAYPGLEAEERGQGEAIARNIYDMMGLKVPIICVVIGEGASGGALGIGVGDKVLMLENSWYSVISPENCSSILWRSWAQKEIAAEQLKLTSENMLEFGLVDGVIPEPLGGAHWNYDEAAKNLKEYIIPILKKLEKIKPQDRIDQRIKKFSDMGFWEEEEEKHSKKSK